MLGRGTFFFFPVEGHGNFFFREGGGVSKPTSVRRMSLTTLDLRKKTLRHQQCALSPVFLAHPAPGLGRSGPSAFSLASCWLSPKPGPVLVASFIKTVYREDDAHILDSLRSNHENDPAPHRNAVHFHMESTNTRLDIFMRPGREGWFIPPSWVVLRFRPPSWAWFGWWRSCFSSPFAWCGLPRPPWGGAPASPP